MLTVFTVIGLVLLLVLLVSAASWWFNQGFFGFWMGWNLMESAAKVLGVLIEVLAQAFSKNGD